MERDATDLADPADAPLALPPHPPEPAPPGFPWLATSRPSPAPLVLWTITGSALSLAFAALGPVVAVASLFDARRQGRRARRAGAIDRAERLIALRGAIAARHDHERAAAWRRAVSARRILDDASADRLAGRRPWASGRSGGARTRASCGSTARRPTLDDREVIDRAARLDGRPACSRRSTAASASSDGPARQVGRARPARAGRASLPSRPRRDQAALRCGVDLGDGAAASSSAARCSGSSTSTCRRGGTRGIRPARRDRRSHDRARGGDRRAAARARDHRRGRVADARDRGATGRRLRAPRDRARAGGRVGSRDLGGRDTARRAREGVGSGADLPARVPLESLAQPLAPPDSRAHAPRRRRRRRSGPARARPRRARAARDRRRARPAAARASSCSHGSPALARTHPPDRVSFLLVDFKGGAAFEPIRDLPHVAGIVTDLDEPEAERAMLSLRAELRHRESRAVAEHVRDIVRARRRTSNSPGWSSSSTSSRP